MKQNHKIGRGPKYNIRKEFVIKLQETKIKKNYHQINDYNVVKYQRNTVYEVDQCQHQSLLKPTKTKSPKTMYICV